MSGKKYCESLVKYIRFKTRVVDVGGVPLGGSYPIRIQSMTTTNTMDTNKTVEQALRMTEAGCEYVRITAPSINEAKNLENIKNELLKRGCRVPLIADIHFTPNAAEIAARIVSKVRINPGNFADKKKFETINYDDKTYELELEKIASKLIPLLTICKKYGTALRIGSNHGSLSDRIMSRYGDSPLGMVESALEFVRICRGQNFHNIVLSMKASNPQIMVHAYRLLVNKMMEEEMDYPLHLGVTEAGDGEDGRIKSALGIGALLEDGLGDTVRVSLTEEPENEIPPAKKLIERYNGRAAHKPIPEIKELTFDPFSYSRRAAENVSNIGGASVPVVVADLRAAGADKPETLESCGYIYDRENEKWGVTDFAADYIYIGDNYLEFEIPASLKSIINYGAWKKSAKKISALPLFSFDEFIKAEEKSFILNFIEVCVEDIFREDFIDIDFSNSVFVLRTGNLHGMAEQRRAFLKLQELNIKTPVVIKRKYDFTDAEASASNASTDIGTLLIDGFGDGVWIEKGENISVEPANMLSFGILQAARMRISKTEYIACPSCGRTLFDLQEVTAKIRKQTGHLKGIKIAIMGCIVNGPGEMADADYGYVGSGIGTITLYKGKNAVQKNIKSDEAVDKLIELIKNDGNWRESN